MTMSTSAMVPPMMCAHPAMPSVRRWPPEKKCTPVKKRSCAPGDTGSAAKRTPASARVVGRVSTGSRSAKHAMGGGEPSPACRRGATGGRAGGRGGSRSGVFGVFEVSGPADSSVMDDVVESCRRRRGRRVGAAPQRLSSGLAPRDGGRLRRVGRGGKRDGGHRRSGADQARSRALSSRGDGAGCDDVAGSVRCVGDAARALPPLHACGGEL